MPATPLLVHLGRDSISARHYPATTSELVSPAGRPCVVMAHGVGATQDSGLQPFARGIAESGVDVITFDYRHFGQSSGAPRQLVSLRRQRADYHAVVRHAREIPGVDPNRIVVW